VPVKSVAQQVVVALHRLREQWMATRTARINALRGILREQGVMLAAGAGPALRAIPALLEDADNALANPLCRTISHIFEEVRQLEARIDALERELQAVADADPVATRLREIPGNRIADSDGIGRHRASHPRVSSRAAVCELAGTDTARIFQRCPSAARWYSQRGDVYLRCLLTHGAPAVLHAADRRTNAQAPLTRLHEWALTVEARRGRNKATIAVANKLGRAVWTHDVAFDPRPARQAA
jgi:transposase